MATPKTQDEYVAALPEASRNVAQRLRALVRRAAPESTEAIKYGIPAFLIDGAAFIYLAVWKQHVGVYPVYEAPPALEKRVSPFRSGKDTLRFPLSKPLDLALITALVKFKLSTQKKKKPTRKERRP